MRRGQAVLIGSADRFVWSRRLIEASKAAVGYVCNTSTPDLMSVAAHSALRLFAPRPFGRRSSGHDPLAPAAADSPLRPTPRPPARFAAPHRPIRLRLWRQLLLKTNTLCYVWIHRAIRPHGGGGRGRHGRGEAVEADHAIQPGGADRARSVARRHAAKGRLRRKAPSKIFSVLFARKPLISPDSGKEIESFGRKSKHLGSPCAHKLEFSEGS